MATYCAQNHVFQKETLYLKNRSCGPRVSRDLADVLCSSTSLRAVILERVSLHDSLCEYMREEIITGSMVSIYTDLLLWWFFQTFLDIPSPIQSSPVHRGHSTSSL